MNLRRVFDEAKSNVPLDMLANYLVGAQIALMQGRLEKKRASSTSKNLTETFHRLQRAAIRDAFSITE